MPVCIDCVLMCGAREVERLASTFRSAESSSRRMCIHSVAFRLLCWKRSMSGVERRREVYWRWS